METKTSKLIKLGLFAAGAYVLYKNYKRDGFWKGAIAAMLITGTIGISFYEYKKEYKK